jgi:hypothetical protein
MARCVSQTYFPCHELCGANHCLRLRRFRAAHVQSAAGEPIGVIIAAMFLLGIQTTFNRSRLQHRPVRQPTCSMVSGTTWQEHYADAAMRLCGAI